MEYCNFNYCFRKRVTDGNSGLVVGLLESLVSHIAYSKAKWVPLTLISNSWYKFLKINFVGSAKVYWAA